MQGRWTINPCPECDDAKECGCSLEHCGHHGARVATPVVPCDPAAIERGAREIATAHRHEDAPAYDDASDTERARWRGFAERVLRAAGETP